MALQISEWKVARSAAFRSGQFRVNEIEASNCEVPRRLPRYGLDMKVQGFALAGMGGAHEDPAELQARKNPLRDH